MADLRFKNIVLTYMQSFYADPPGKLAVYLLPIVLLAELDYVLNEQ